MKVYHPGNGCVWRDPCVAPITNHLKIRIMKQRIKEFCDEYMWFILPACSSLAIMLGVVIEKHFPLSEILSEIL